MTSDYRRLLRQDFSDLDDASVAWENVSHQMESAFDRHRQRVTGPLHASWKGDDATAALGVLEETESDIDVVRTEAMAIATTLHTTKVRMKQAQMDLRSAVRRAEEDNYAVDNDGLVTDPTVEGFPRNDPEAQRVINERGGPRTRYQQQINDAIKDAEAADTQGRRALSRLGGDVMDRRHRDRSAESARDVTKAMKDLGLKGPQVPQNDPKAASAWWKSLDADERREYATLYPERIGGTDGLPSDVRDDANRLALEQELNRLETTRGGDEDRIRNLETLRDQMDRHDGAARNKQLYLLDFDSSGDGKAVIAMGNPDTARHTGILVPGTDTTIDSTPGQLKRVGKLQDAATADAGEGNDVAMVWWLGYDAPEVDTSVASDDRAQDAAPHLRQFVEGTRAAHEGAPSHVTVMGHSYGSTTVGAAASGGHGLGADDVLVVGSPGMTVDHARDLHMDPDHVWVGAAKDDPVIDWAADLTLGGNPAEEPFGGHNFRVDTHGHSGYWDNHSESLHNQGKIIAGGSPTQVPKDENDIPFLPWW